jgi:hypothetical protein
MFHVKREERTLWVDVSGVPCDIFMSLTEDIFTLRLDHLQSDHRADESQATKRGPMFYVELLHFRELEKRTMRGDQSKTQLAPQVLRRLLRAIQAVNVQPGRRGLI